jgi:hypothetical protein
MVYDSFEILQSYYKKYIYKHLMCTLFDLSFYIAVWKLVSRNNIDRLVIDTIVYQTGKNQTQLHVLDLYNV